MNHENYQRAADYWIKKDAEHISMEHNKCMDQIIAYIEANNTCALATGTGSFIRCTPIEYSYHEDAFWMFSEGGQKFVGLETNKNVCLAIYDKYNGFGTLKGMQISGIAELIEPFSEEYIKAAEYKKIPITALKKLPNVMHLIKIIPNRIDFLNSDFKKEGCDSRQSVIL